MVHGTARAVGAIGAALISAVIGWSTAQAADAATLPQYSPDKHIGVTTCAGSTGHGSAAPWKNSSVQQNEYITWEQKDKHAKAYAALKSDRAARITRNLGLKAATEEPVCLNCHADNIPVADRGKPFNIADGVSCEACHGGAEHWLGVHVSGVGSHADNVKAGMYPTDDPVARANLCMSCHIGIASKYVTHRMMGAGHPRMPFELDTFTAIEPAHYKVDDDYRKRKHAPNGVQVWAIGQAEAVSHVLDGLVDPKRNHDGIFPEMTFFDCFACHHPMSQLRWEPRASTGLGPGIPRLNDANLVMLRVIAQTVDPGLGSKLAQETKALHQASVQGQDATVAAAKALKATTAGLVEKFAQHQFGRSDMSALLSGLVKEGTSGEYVNYMAAEQATMALGSIVAAMRTSSLIDEAQYKTMKTALDKCYDAVAKDEQYSPATYRTALETFASTIPKS